MLNDFDNEEKKKQESKQAGSGEPPIPGFMRSSSFADSFTRSGARDSAASGSSESLNAFIDEIGDDEFAVSHDDGSPQQPPVAPPAQPDSGYLAILKNAESYMERAQFGEARTILEQLLQTLDQSPTADQSQLAACLRDLADVYMFFGEPEAALKARRRFLEITRGRPDRNYIIVLSQVLAARQASPDSQANEALYVEALDLVKALLPADDPLYQQVMRLWSEFQNQQLSELAPANLRKNTVEQSLPASPRKNTVEQSLPASPTPSQADLDAIAERRKALAESAELSRKTVLEHSVGRGNRLSSKLVTPVLVGVLLLVCAALFTVLNHKPAQQETTTKDGAYEPIEYQACDGIKALRLLSKDDCLLTEPGKQISAKYKMVSSSDLLALISAPQEGLQIWLQQGDNGLIDREGTVLYSPNAPELTVAKKMLSYGEVASRKFKETKLYPGDEAKMKSALGAAYHYTNPLTGKVFGPPVVYKKFAASAESFKDQALAGLPWQDEPQFQPGEIHFACLDYCRLLIRGFDRNGRPLRASRPVQCFFVELKDGDNLTAQEMSQASTTRGKEPAAKVFVYISSAPGLEMTVQALRAIIPLFLLAIVLVIVASVARRLIVANAARTTAHDKKFKTKS